MSASSLCRLKTPLTEKTIPLGEPERVPPGEFYEKDEDLSLFSCPGLFQRPFLKSAVCSIVLLFLNRH